MKKLLYIFIGIGITLGCGALYAFKARQTSEVSCVIVVQVANDILLYYGNGTEEKATKIFNVSIGSSWEKKEVSLANMIPKTLEYLYQKGYKVIGESKGVEIKSSLNGTGGYGGSYFCYTLIKEN